MRILSFTLSMMFYSSCLKENVTDKISNRRIDCLLYNVSNENTRN